MSTKYIVDNVSGQTINGDLTINGNVVITGTTNTRPYKVFTALLTQSGGDNNIELNSGELTIGITYRIEGGIREGDFTNVGAPNNEVGTYFVATGTIPASWGINEGFGAILSYNEGAPIVTVLENTIGNITWIYQETGYYTGDLTDGFIGDLFFQNDKVVFFSNNVEIGQMAINIYKNDDNQIGIDAFKIDGTYVDSALNNVPIEIRVYN